MHEELRLRGKKSTFDNKQINSVFALTQQIEKAQWLKVVFNDRSVKTSLFVGSISLIAGLLFSSYAFLLTINAAIFFLIKTRQIQRQFAASAQQKPDQQLLEIKNRLGHQHKNLAEIITKERNRVLSNWKRFQQSDFPFAEQIERYETEAYQLILLLQERRIEILRLEKRDFKRELDETAIRLASSSVNAVTRENLERRKKLLEGQQSSLTELQNSVELIELQVNNIFDFYSLLNSKIVAMPGDTIGLKHIGEEIDVLAESIDQTKRMLEEVDRKVLSF